MGTIFSGSVTGFPGYTAVGVGLRNEPSGIISIKLPAGATVVAAYLIYSIMGSGTDPYAGAPPTITVQRSGGPSVVFAANNVGVSTDLCWGSSGNWGYWANVLPVVTGTGKYTVTGFPSGLTNKLDPWTSSPPPDAEGATLIVVYTLATGPVTNVQIYVGDTSLFGNSFAQALSFPTASSGGATTTFIVADGQVISGAGDLAVVNSHILAGPGSTVRPLDAFPGADKRTPAGSQGNLWDSLTLKIKGSVLHAGSTSAIFNVTSGINPTTSGYDCIGWMGQALATHG